MGFTDGIAIRQLLLSRELLRGSAPRSQKLAAKLISESVNHPFIAFLYRSATASQLTTFHHALM
jgi:hypothetical protein